MSSNLEINFVKFTTSQAVAKITKMFTLNLQLIENRIEQWRQRYEREKKMYEREICKVRNEIEDARKYLEELTTEVMIRKLCEKYFHFIPAAGTPQRSNLIYLPRLIILTTAIVNLNCRIKRIPAGIAQQAQSLSYFAFSV